MKTGYRVCDAMTKAPISISPEATIKECADIMNKERLGSLLVKKDSQLLGIITDQDIVRKIIAKGADPLTTKIENHMEKNLITISPEKDIFDAITLMANRNIKQLPVMDGDVMLGLLTQKDVLKIEPELFDLLVDKLEIREEPHKPIMNEGLCSDCGNYSDRLIKNNDSLLCNECNK
ncbi:CBS domain-containing protein [Candidatus Woesearchaeota archaeon]|nr:CBS domain-containing protein [Candidatus Woesearchaeota archaeon]